MSKAGKYFQNSDTQPVAAAAQPGGYNGEAAAQFEEGSSPHFHPPAIFGGGDFFYLPFYLQHLSSFKLCSLFYILLSDAQPMKMVP